MPVEILESDMVAPTPFLRSCSGRLCSRTVLSGGRDLSQEVTISVLVDSEVQPGTL